MHHFPGGALLWEALFEGWPPFLEYPWNLSYQFLNLPIYKIHQCGLNTALENTIRDPYFSILECLQVPSVTRISLTRIRQFGPKFSSRGFEIAELTSDPGSDGEKDTTKQE